jgi:hypothetical protein
VTGRRTSSRSTNADDGAKASVRAQGAFRRPDRENASSAVHPAGDGVPEHRYAFRKVVQAVKGVVDLQAYAGELTPLRRSGATLVGRCPLPDHEDRTPSFTVWPGSDSWWCFGCDRGSDVIDLYYHLHGCTETWEALVGLSLERGVALPGRSGRWHRATRRKAEYRDTAYRVLGNVLKRRLYRTLVLPYIDLIEDPEEHERELERSWREWAGWWRWPRLAQELVAGDRDALGAVAAEKAEAGRATSEATRERKPGP